MLDMHADTEISSGLFYIKNFKIIKNKQNQEFRHKKAAAETSYNLWNEIWVFVYNMGSFNFVAWLDVAFLLFQKYLAHNPTRDGQSVHTTEDKQK